MKKNKFKYFSLTTITTAILLIAGLSSCLKDKNSERYDNSPALVSFQYAGNSALPFTAAILGTPQDSFPIEVTLSVASLTLSTPVTATIAVDEASLDAYNADETTSTFPTTYTMLDASNFILPNGGQVTINPGQQIVSFTVKFAGDKINFTQDIALALKITSAQGATIATNLNTAIVLLKLKSIYEGAYDQDGILNRYTGAVADPAKYVDNFPITGSYGFTTVTANSIEGQIVIPGFAPTYTKLTVDFATNIVTISPSAIAPSTDMKNQAGKTSTYDPATNTFDIHGQFLNSAGNLRLFDFTMSLQ